MTDRRAYRVSGRVQGVGFRWWARDEATRLDLRGWVRNDPDGTVRLEVEGSGESLDRLEDLLRVGPPAARVHEVHPQTPTPRPLPDGFEIAR
jgi:acylphosphatase